MVWGLFVFICILIEKTFLLKFFDKLPSFVSRIYFILVLIVSMTIFNGKGISGSVNDVISLFGFGGHKFINSDTVYYLSSNAVLLVISAIASTPLLKTIVTKLKDKTFGRD